MGRQRIECFQIIAVGLSQRI